MAKKHDAALRIKPLYQKGAQSLSDTEALEVKGIYPKWVDLLGAAAEVDYKFTHDGALYKVIQAHTFTENWIPGTGTESLYTVIDEEHAGTIDNPIPYNGNMALEAGKYYIQDGVVYYCNRDTGNPVYSPLAELVGLFVEVANG